MTERIDVCGCFPTGPEPAARPDNAPGLDRLAYRVASHPVSLARMLADLPGPNSGTPLGRLTTREPDDPAIAMLDAAAVVADVLSFYSERIANEGYLRTATERLSILELAREIGYELGPGVAAETYLAFTIDDRPLQPGTPAEALIPQGTRVQSLPLSGGPPQPFETADAFLGKASWNQLRPILTAPQALDDTVETIYLAGTATGLRDGDVLLLALAGPTGAIDGTPRPRLAHRVVIEGDLLRTRVELASTPQPAQAKQKTTFLERHIGVEPKAFTAVETDYYVGGGSWSERTLQVLLAVNEWTGEGLERYYEPKPTAPPDLGPGEPGVFAFRQRAAVFGHNAPLYAQLPDAVKIAYPDPWDDPNTGVNVTTNSQGDDLGSTTVRLDTTYRVAPDGWVILTSGTPDQGKAYRIATATEPSLADFALSAKVTQLALKTAAGADPSDLTAFTPRATSVHVASERLLLAEVPLPSVIDAGETGLDLDRLVLGLAVGQRVALTGERADFAGVSGTEIVTLSAVEHAGGRTMLTFGALQNAYLRRTVTLNANVVLASHGETVAREVLGSGTGLAEQRFRLRRPPVTHRTAPTGTGAASSLEIRVDGVRWTEVASFVDAGMRDEWFVTRRDDEGRTSVLFGDGVQGARPPTGAENVTADYRTGTGLVGNLGAGSLTLLATRPPGVKEVTNPVPAAGAEDPEARDAARDNAPLTVATLGRIVSLADYEDFARAFAGIGKARATHLWRGERRLVHVSVAGPGGAEVPNQTVANLREALDASRDPGIALQVAGRSRILVRLAADVLIDPRLEAAPVIERVRAALAIAFGFDRRAFGDPVSAAQAIAVILSVPGVVDTAIAALYPVTDSSGTAPAIPVQDPILARLARWTGTGEEVAPAELALLEPAGATITERSS